MRPERAPRPSLASVQAALLSRITGQALGAPAFDAASLIRGDARASAEERLAVYSFMYGSRLVEALESQFPRLAAPAGRRAFADAHGRLRGRRPSRHPSLRELGRALPAWLAAQRPERTGAGGAGGARVGARRRLRSRRRARHDAGRAPRLSAGALRRAAAQVDRGAPVRRGRPRDRGAVGRARTERGASAGRAPRVAGGRSRRHAARLAPRRSPSITARSIRRSARRSLWSRPAAGSASSVTRSPRAHGDEAAAARAFAWLSTWIADGLLIRM